MKPTRPRTNRRGGALFLSVLATALIVTLLGLAGLQITRIERGQMTAQSDRRTARMNASSAVELALHMIANDPDWRNTYESGTETPQKSLGRYDAGYLSWVLEDADGNLNNVDLDLKLKGIGRVGPTVQVTTLSLDSSEVAVGPAELYSMTNQVSLADADIANNLWGCQYLRPNLPANAIKWWVTSVEILCQRANSNQTLRVRLYEPLATNWPSNTLIDEVSVNSDSIDGLLWTYHRFNFSGGSQLNPGQGVCVALETSSSLPPISVRYRTSGVTDPNSALIAGTPVWDFRLANASLCYRVHGVYQVPSSTVTPITGSWVWDAAP